METSTLGNSLISDALEYYDKHTDTYQIFLDKIKRAYFNVSETDQHSTVNLYDKNDNLIHTSRYEIIGVYNNIGKIWTWAWAMPINKNATYIIRKILNYGIDLDSTNLFLKTELITSRFKISSDVQLDMHAAIAAYMGKQKLIFKHYPKSKHTGTDTANTTYMFLLDLPDIGNNGKPNSS